MSGWRCSVCLSFGAIGFYDDYTKVRKKHNLGLTARQKFGLQVVACLAIGMMLLSLHAKDAYDTAINVPFLKNFRPDLLIPSLLSQSVDIPAGVRVLLSLHGPGYRGLIELCESDGWPGWACYRADDHRRRRDDDPVVCQRSRGVRDSISTLPACPAPPN